MNRQAAKNAKKRKRANNVRQRITENLPDSSFALFFSLVFSWRPWRLGGSS
jgi:hypothetical protein